MAGLARRMIGSTIGLMIVLFALPVYLPAQELTAPTEAEMKRRLQLQRTLNESLERRIEALEAELNTNLCETLLQDGLDACLQPSSIIDFSRTTRPVSPTALGPSVTVLPGAADETLSPSVAPPQSVVEGPKGEEDVAASDPELTPEPTAEAAPAQQETPSTEAPTIASLEIVNELERASVFIVVPETGATGSGFMIGDGLVLTNQHVIAGIAVGMREEIIITSESLGRPYLAVVLHTSPEAEPGSPDYAVLKAEDLSGNPVLSFAPSVSKLDTVYAAGYPGIVVTNDSALTRLFEGNFEMAPDLVLSSGEVSAIQESNFGEKTIVHTASIMSGNSGGPLMDACGRIVGINTYISADQESASRAGFALSSEGILTFLNRTGTSSMLDERPCGAR